MPAKLPDAVVAQVRKVWGEHTDWNGVRVHKEVTRRNGGQEPLGVRKVQLIIAEASHPTHGQSFKPFQPSKWVPWKVKEDSETSAYLLRLNAISLVLNVRPLYKHEAIWGRRLRAAVSELGAYDQFCFVSLYALRQSVASNLQEEIDTADLDVILAYKPWPWLPENSHAYAMATTYFLAPRPRTGSRAEYPWSPDRTEKLSVRESVRNFNAGRAWETLKVDLRLYWHYRIRPDLSESAPEPFANFGVYPNQDQILEFWMGDNPLFEPPAEHGMYGLSEPEDEIADDFTDQEEVS